MSFQGACRLKTMFWWVMDNLLFFFKGKTSGFVMKPLVNHGVARDLNDQPELFPFQTSRNTFDGDFAFTNSKRGYRFQCLILIGPTTKVQ